MWKVHPESRIHSAVGYFSAAIRTSALSASSSSSDVIAASLGLGRVSYG